MLFNSCCCQPGCIFVGPLAFASGSVGDNFSTSSGSWSISSGTLRTTSASALITGLVANPNADANTKVQVDITMSTAGDLARVYLDDTDWSIEVKYGTGSYIRILEGSTERARCDCTIATGTHAVCASINGSVIRGTIVASTGPTVLRTAETTGSFSGDGWGLGTGGTVTGTVQFDNVTVSIVSEDCAECEEGDCPIESDCTAICTVIPPSIDVTIDHIVNLSCGECDSLNGTWNAPFIPEESDEDQCTFRGPIATICTTLNYFVQVNITASGILVQLSHGAGEINYIRWFRSHTAPIDCSALFEETINYLERNVLRCNIDGSFPFFPVEISAGT